MSDDDQDIENDGIGAEEAVSADSLLLAKENERRRIQAEVEEFLRNGGNITQVDTNVMTDPPRRPESNYGGQPI